MSYGFTFSLRTLFLKYCLAGVEFVLCRGDIVRRVQNISRISFCRCIRKPLKGVVTSGQRHVFRTSW